MNTGEQNLLLLLCFTRFVAVDFSNYLNISFSRTRGHHMRFMTIPARINTLYHSFLPIAIRLWKPEETVHSPLFFILIQYMIIWYAFILIYSYIWALHNKKIDFLWLHAEVTDTDNLHSTMKQLYHWFKWFWSFLW